MYADVIQKRTRILPTLSRTLSELVTHVNALNKRIDSLSRSTTSPNESTCAQVLSHIPIQTEAALDAFEEKLEDPEFRHEFVSIFIILEVR